MARDVRRCGSWLDGKPNLPPVRTTRQRDSGPSVRIGLMRNVAPIVIRLYDPLTLIIPQGAEMPQLAATIPTPNCLLCNRHSHLPPAKTAWISAADVETIAVICTDCDCADQAELERKIIEQVSAAAPKIDISQPTAAEAILVPPTWATAAAREWVQPAA
jgi:hypothetical protein